MSELLINIDSLEIIISNLIFLYIATTRVTAIKDTVIAKGTIKATTKVTMVDTGNRAFS